MINTAILFIANELEQYLIREFGRPVEVVLDNIALLEAEDNQDLQDKVIITLVNVEEESTLKNTSHYRRNANGSMDVIQPPVWLNLYLLFSCNFPKLYPDALLILSRIIQFFQSITELSGMTPLSGVPDVLNFNEEELADLKLTFELYTLTFEQINHLWGALGGKQVPSVLYKVRMISIRDRRVSRESPMITEIRSE